MSLDTIVIVATIIGGIAWLARKIDAQASIIKHSAIVAESQVEVGRQTGDVLLGLQSCISELSEIIRQMTPPESRLSLLERRLEWLEKEQQK
jgi:hypothetical protein